MPTEPDDPNMPVEAAAQRIQQAYNDECGECGSRLDLTDALILARAALKQAAVVAAEEQDKPSAVCTPEDHADLKRIAWGEGYAVGCLANKELLKSCLCVLSAAKYGQTWSGNMLKDFAHCIDGLRTALSTSNDSGARQE